MKGKKKFEAEEFNNIKEIIYNSAKKYKDNLENKNILFIFLKQQN